MTTRKLQGPLGGDYQTDGKGNAVLLNTYPLTGEDDIPTRLADHEARVTAAEGTIASQGSAIAANTSALAARPTNDEVTSMLAGATSGALPAVPNLHARWAADTLALADGARVSSWLDMVSSRDAAQAISGNQPLYVANALNGKPGVYFDKNRGDRLVATIAPTGGNTTIVMVAVPATPYGEMGFVLGSNASVKNIYHDRYSNGPHFGGQASIAPSVMACAAAPQIVAVIFDGAASEIRVNSVATATDLGTHATPSTSLTIGHRASLSGNSYTGTICELLWYDRALTAGECASIEQYLGAKYAIGAGAQSIWHVSSIAGDDANSGRSAASPIRTMDRLMEGLRASAALGAPLVAYMDAPEGNPLRIASAAVFNFAPTATISLLAADTSRPWHLYGSERVTGGWTHTGGGIYSHPLTRSSAAGLIAWLPDLLDSDGLPVRAHTNASVQTAPAAGEFGWSANVYYLHLPGDVDPNAHAVEIPLSSGVLINNYSLVIEDGVFAGATSNAVGNSGAGSMLTARRSTAKHAQSGFAIAGGVPGSLWAERCLGTLCVNDGFNLHGAGGLATLVDCEGSWNDDEGASPHETVTLTIAGGRYHHNGSGGITAVNSAVLDLLPYQGQPVEVDHNRRLVLPAYPNMDRGGVVALDTVVANVSALNSHDNPGPGISRQSTTTWNVLGTVTSGTAAGNGVADEVV